MKRNINMLFSRDTEIFRNPGTFNPGDKLYKEGAKKKPTIFNNYQDDDSTMHFSKESQYDAGPAMPKQVAAGSAMPQYEDDPMTEPEMTKPSLFGGMDRPERAKPKWYDYALSFLLPALQGGLSGQGALSGLVSGASNMLSNKFKNQAKDEANWEKDREFGQKERGITADKELAGAKLGIDLDNNRFERKLKLADLDLKQNPVPRAGEITPAEFKAALEHKRKREAAGKAVSPEALSTIKAYQQTKRIDPLDYED